MGRRSVLRPKISREVNKLANDKDLTNVLSNMDHTAMIFVTVWSAPKFLGGEKVGRNERNCK